MKTVIYNLKGEEVGESDLPSEIFGFKKLNHDLMHQALVAQIANSRQVIAHTKTRKEVKGGGRKPWRQKGTGRARHGSIRSPLWKGGGVTFGPRKNKNFSKKINKKMKRKALFMALSSKVLDKEIVLVDKLVLRDAKTNAMIIALNSVLNAKFRAVAQRAAAGAAKSLPSLPPSLPPSRKLRRSRKLWQAGKCQIGEKGVSALLVLPGKNNNVVRASGNIPKVQAIRADSLNILDVLKYKYLIIPKRAVKVIKATYLK